MNNTSYTAEEILGQLDDCARSFTFPMLDNEYVYLAASRLSAFRTDHYWALVIEIIGFSPRGGIPDIFVSTFASDLYRRNTPEQYASPAAYENYIANNPHNESRTFFPIEEGAWQDPECDEYVAEDARQLLLRGRPIQIPSLESYAAYGIELEAAPRVHTFELCRYLAATSRDEVLATEQERRVSIAPELVQILTLDDWNHPNIVDDTQLPSGSETFQQLAMVLTTGDAALYRPSVPGNTHWRNWPDGGTL